jgi:hypothetical protein
MAHLGILRDLHLLSLYLLSPGAICPAVLGQASAPALNMYRRSGLHSSVSWIS